MRLKTEKEIIQNWTGDSTAPLVSICCITYNHEKYIEDALKGFLFQDTVFPFEIIIHDDNSHDQTASIIRKYETIYPNLIKAIYQTENQYSKGIRIFAKYIFPKTKGKYIAMCEGDDYWTDQNKLQKQVDFLETNPDFSICFHNMKVIHEGKPGLNRSSNINQQEITDIKILAHNNYIYTASCIFRKHFNQIPDWFFQCPIGDYPLHLLNAQFGKIKFLHKKMGIYRVHQNGIWEVKSLEYRLEKWIEMIDILRNKFSEDINQILSQQLYNSYFQLAEYYYNHSEHEKCEHYLMKIIHDDSHSIIEPIKKMFQEITRVKSSPSWRLTKPLRFFLFLFDTISKYFHK